MNKTGFGFLRLPRADASNEMSVNYSLLNAMVDRFIQMGGTYFDTAYTYLGGISEEAIRKAVVERYPRGSFQIADKLPGYKVKSYEECYAYFEESLRRCGVDYFDVFLLHWINDKNYELAEKYSEFQFLQQLKQSGKVRKTGFSYHDGPELLDRILSKHPEVDYVQLQINYLDWDSVSLQAARCYEVAVKHGKQIIVMEPVKGGSLANIPENAETVLKQIHPGESTASWAIRFASSLENVEIVLSGMNSMEQMEDNMRQFEPLTYQEKDALALVAEIIRSNTAVPCTGCGYCAPNCPVNMPIPEYFALYNEYSRHPQDDWKMQHTYESLAKNRIKASACLSCGQCERNCPQKIEITKYLSQTVQVFEA